jgi:glycosyltransferase involved in cell wall biosynthesis
MSGARRIAHVVENLERGGLERVVIDLAREQARRGDAVQVLCLFDRGALADELEGAGVPVHACGKRGGLDVAALWRLRTQLRAHRTTVMHSHNAAAHYHAVLAAAGLGIRTTVNTRHGMGVRQAGSRREWLFRRALPWTDRVATVCEAARREVAASGLIPAAKLVAVPNGIRLDAFAPGGAAERAALAVELGFPPGTPVVGAVGRMNWAKDPQGMLQAFRILLVGHPQAVLAWAGDGAERPAFEAAARAAGIADRVRALGDRGDVPRLLRGFTLYAMSSRTEGYSIALLEACASGLPIVATDVGGNREIVREGVNGRLVPAGDPQALASALAGLLDDPERAAVMGAAGRAFAEIHGSLAAMADRYAALYDAGR